MIKKSGASAMIKKCFGVRAMIKKCFGARAMIKKCIWVRARTRAKMALIPRLGEGIFGSL